MIIKRKVYKKILSYVLGCDSCGKQIKGTMVVVAIRKSAKGIHGRKQWDTKRKFNFHLKCMRMKYMQGQFRLK